DQPYHRDIGVEILGDTRAHAANLSMCRQPDQATPEQHVVHERFLLPAILPLLTPAIADSSAAITRERPTNRRRPHGTTFNADTTELAEQSRFSLRFREFCVDRCGQPIGSKKVWLPFAWRPGSLRRHLFAMMAGECDRWVS